MYNFNNSLVFRIKLIATLFPSLKLSIPNVKGRDMFLLFSLFLHFFFKDLTRLGGLRRFSVKITKILKK